MQVQDDVTYMSEVLKLDASWYKEAIVEMNNSEEYLALKKYYAEESFIKILRVSREERIHSNFIAWLLNPKSHHELAYYPLQKFLQMLSVVSKKENNAKVCHAIEQIT